MSSRCWCHGDTGQDCAETMSKHAMDTMCGLMDYMYSNRDDGRRDMLSVILTPSQVKLFFSLYENKRESGSAERGYS